MGSSQAAGAHLSRDGLQACFRALGGLFFSQHRTPSLKLGQALAHVSDPLGPKSPAWGVKGSCHVII